MKDFTFRNTEFKKKQGLKIDDGILRFKTDHKHKWN